jgi:chromosomal replication initiation ATPase DnaA
MNDKIKQIIEYLGKRFNLPEDYYLIKWNREYVAVKKIAITLIMDNTDLTLWQIANIFQINSHGSMIDAHNVVDDMIFLNKKYKNEYTAICEDLNMKYKPYYTRTARHKA